MKGIILHGGKGTRLRPLTHTGPKQLIPIANKPMSQYALEDLQEAGIKDIAIILGNIAPEKVIDCYGDGSEFGVRINYIRQEEPKGIAHAISLARDFVGEEPFVVYLGDNLLKNGIIECVKNFIDSGSAAHIALCQVDNPQDFGSAELNDKGHIIKLIEKPKSPKSDLALIGVYMFRRAIFDSIEKLKPSWRGELEITDAIQGLIDQGYNVSSHIISGWWKDTGKPDDLLEANQFVLSEMKPAIDGKVEDNVVTDGILRIGKGSHIKSNSRLKGPLIIGEKCIIGPNSYVGPFTSIGNYVTISGSEVENSIILDKSTIRCNKRIIDSIIGRCSEIISSKDDLPKGYSFIVGENTYLKV